MITVEKLIDVLDKNTIQRCALNSTDSGMPFTVMEEDDIINIPYRYLNYGVFSIFVTNDGILNIGVDCEAREISEFTIRDFLSVFTPWISYGEETKYNEVDIEVRGNWDGDYSGYLYDTPYRFIEHKVKSIIFKDNRVKIKAI